MNSTATYIIINTYTHHINTLSLHDALPIYTDGIGQLQFTLAGQAGCHHILGHPPGGVGRRTIHLCGILARKGATADRKSTRLNSSHVRISYAVFCLKKKNEAL